MSAKKYSGSWNANGQSSYGYTYDFGSLREAKRVTRSICQGNTHHGSTGYWSIYRADEVIAEGKVGISRVYSK